jgi:uncharacterized membrane protein
MFIWKTFMLLALIVWIGGLIFFSFVVAPALFTVLPSTALAGNVVSRCLAALHWIGIVSAVVFLVCSLLYSRAKFAQLKPLMLVNVLVVIMLVLTLISQFAITPRIHRLRSQLQLGGAVQDSIRIEFDRLHAWSMRLEGGVLVLGVVVVGLTARRFS